MIDFSSQHLLDDNINKSNFHMESFDILLLVDRDDKRDLPRLIEALLLEMSMFSCRTDPLESEVVKEHLNTSQKHQD